ncbi:LAQU0S12e00694g1_1 [Lachancea quebecensis]|uniref:LAQU0S12e00694g1_1 n=1 Tax=Lachancea quebecensis TaxID=1654605 RepID=A0A0P1KU84_9SACH|nr:LAQU0S12e00694g1_1 [Lachancea quebecensis]
MTEQIYKQSSPVATLYSESPLPADSPDVAHPNALSSVVPEPIYVSREQSSGLVTKSGLSALQHTIASLNVFQHLPRDASQGVDDLRRMKMALVSGIPDEVHWALKKYLAYSNKAPFMIGLKSNRDLIPLFNQLVVEMEPLLRRFDMPLSAENDEPILQRGLNTILVLRNLAQDTESTQVLATNSILKGFILSVLQLFNAINSNAFSLYSKNAPFFNELIHYVIDLMEAISSYIAPARKDDPYFQNLVSILTDTNDRYMVISILRSLSRLLVRSKADEESAADNLHNNILDQITSFLLIDCDSELITASLDFLYQYVLPGNERIATLLRNKQRYAILSAVLPRLLSYNVRMPDYDALLKTEIKLTRRVKPPAPTDPPKLDKDLFSQILELNEPMRSSAWLWCCFEQAADAEVTQISLWRGYESEFSQAVKESGRKLLPAVEFIKNVSNAFKDASAMVITDPTTGKKRFVIKGIQPRSSPVSIAEGEVSASRPVDKDFLPSSATETNVREATQTTLPSVEFPNKISDVSKASATFLCLISNDSKGIGISFCKGVRPIVLHVLANIPPLNTALAEYMDNVPTA